MENVIFKKFEVVGTTKDEAIAQVDLNLRRNATQAYNKWASENLITNESQNEWLKNFLKQWKFTCAKDGAYIVLQSAITDKRERPYKIENIKYEAKTHTPESYYILRDITGNEVARAKTKKEAEKAIREYITDFKEDVNVYREWVSKEKNSLVMKGTYTPSKGTQDCKLLVFGYVPVD